MLKCASVYTYEVDDCEIALDEIKTQLNEKIILLDNSVGIVMCHTEFIHSGALKYICENLPFDLVGVTTASQAVNGEAGEMVLTVFVITSDDVRFITGVTGDLSESVDGPTGAAFDEAADGIDEQLKLAIVFPPRILKNSGDSYVNAWTKIIPGTPVFGTAATDDTVSFSECETIYNGVNNKTAMPFVLCYGNINPRFMVGTLPKNNVMPYKAEITESSGSRVYKINNMSAYKYFEDIGLAKGGAAIENFLLVPFIIDQKKRADYDGIPVMRVLASFTADGAASFRGNVDENSTFTMLKASPDDILSATLKTIRKINEMQDVNGVLMFPCIIRRMMVMEESSLCELEAARDNMNPEIPFMMGYAGGEICPTSIQNGIPANRFHNYSLVVLII